MKQKQEEREWEEDAALLLKSMRQMCLMELQVVFYIHLVLSSLILLMAKYTYCTIAVVSRFCCFNKKGPSGNVPRLGSVGMRVYHFSSPRDGCPIQNDSYILMFQMAFDPPLPSPSFLERGKYLGISGDTLT